MPVPFTCEAWKGCCVSLEPIQCEFGMSNWYKEPRIWYRITQVGKLTCRNNWFSVQLCILRLSRPLSYPPHVSPLRVSTCWHPCPVLLRLAGYCRNGCGVYCTLWGFSTLWGCADLNMFSIWSNMRVFSHASRCLTSH